MKNNDYIKPLMDLNFTEIEALVYVFLVENSPATGYRISHAIGKQPPNTYKAIAALEDKGAIIVEKGEKKLCRAVPPPELLDNLEQRFRQNRKEADHMLETLSSRSQDSRIYHLKTVDQVIQRSKAMLERAQEIVLCDLFPSPFARLADLLSATASRGVQVYCRVYNGEETPGVKIQQMTEHEPALDYWPGQHISIVVDAEEHLLGLLARDMKSVHEAVWSNSSFLSCMHHNNVASEILFAELKSENKNLLTAAEKKLNHISLMTFRPSGVKSLIQRYNSDAQSIDKDATP